MERTVHIAPLGWEHDRVARPVRDARAHRVHLLVRLDHPRTQHFLDLTQDSLADAGIEAEVVEIDSTREFESTLLHVARLIRRETDAGNRVFVNMSSGGKIAAVASSLAAMYHADRAAGLYYSDPEHYLVGVPDENGPEGLDFEDRGLTAGYQGITELPAFQLNKPSETGIRILVEIYRRSSLSLDEVLEHLHDQGIPPYDSDEIPRFLTAKRKSDLKDLRQKWVQRIRRSEVDDLLTRGLISQEKQGVGGKMRFSLTDSGRYYVLASGLVQKLTSQD